jgi:hypothetical protein
MGLRVRELPVRRIYTGAVRSFGHGLDEPTHRLAVYRDVMHREMRKWAAQLPAAAVAEATFADGGASEELIAHPPAANRVRAIDENILQ